VAASVDGHVPSLHFTSCHSTANSIFFEVTLTRKGPVVFVSVALLVLVVAVELFTSGFINGELEEMFFDDPLSFSKASVHFKQSIWHIRPPVDIAVTSLIIVSFNKHFNHIKRSQEKVHYP
jgi:hypothetical protein